MLHRSIDQLGGHAFFVGQVATAIAKRVLHGGLNSGARDVAQEVRKGDRHRIAKNGAVLRPLPEHRQHLIHPTAQAARVMRAVQVLQPVQRAVQVANQLLAASEVPAERKRLLLIVALELLQQFKVGLLSEEEKPGLSLQPGPVFGQPVLFAHAVKPLCQIDGRQIGTDGLNALKRRARHA
ncbi:hypothetical protein ACFJI0_04440 [Hydrogenophaga sp. UC242_53]|uniref:hypothetical protein n=1 Tax=Hydrogenophaga sp. UC242_53 TaxID=3350170 RepID=UPI0036D39AF8